MLNVIYDIQKIYANFLYLASLMSKLAYDMYVSMQNYVCFKIMMTRMHQFKHLHSIMKTLNTNFVYKLLHTHYNFKFILPL